MSLIKRVWCWFVAYLMVGAFDTTPEEIDLMRRAAGRNVALREELDRVAGHNATLQEEADTWRATAESCADFAKNVRVGSNDRLVKALEEIAASRSHRRAIGIAGEALRGHTHDAETLPAMPVSSVDLLEDVEA